MIHRGHQSLEKGYFRLSDLASQLKGVSPSAESFKEKITLLERDPCVMEVLSRTPFLVYFLEQLADSDRYALLSLIATGQSERVIGIPQLGEDLRQLIVTLFEIDRFYSPLGGIVGYQQAVLGSLLGFHLSSRGASVYPVSGKSIETVCEEVDLFVREGIEKMGEVAEIYVVGGAADRLGLRDPITGDPLPAACLEFCKKPLLQWLIDDLCAREYLHFKLTGEKIETPIALMTSREVHNHDHILSLLEEQNWFGRKKENFHLFAQPLVPTFDEHGDWCLTGKMRLLLRPGGHGAIWKLAKDSGVLAWLLRRGRSKAVVRQINNPIAGTDYNLLAFSGAGLFENKLFGFASCPREVGAKEGVNVVIEREDGGFYNSVLSNIEYPDFARHGIVDEPEANSIYSKFSSNTNILFVDLRAVATVAEENPVPGMLVNLKELSFIDDHGELQVKRVGRLESMMQNIADGLVTTLQTPTMGRIDESCSYLTTGVRRKTISTTKRLSVDGNPNLETPERCVLDMMENGMELLQEHCHVQCEENVFFEYHPMLGPIFSVIGQKIRGGVCKKWSHLNLQIADVDIENLSLSGALMVKGLLGKVTLSGVVVENRGRLALEGDRVDLTSIWVGRLSLEECLIEIEGSGEFEAQDVVIQGGMHIHVRDGEKVTLRSVEGKLVFDRQRLDGPSWEWDYQFDNENKIVIKREYGKQIGKNRGIGRENFNDEEVSLTSI